MRYICHIAIIVSISFVAIFVPTVMLSQTANTMLAASTGVPVHVIPSSFSSSLAGVSLPAPVETKPKFQPFLSNRTNQTMVAGELTVRLMDAVSTREALTNSCHCMIEAGTLYGISLKAAAQSDWTQYSSSMGMASSQIVIADLLWAHASHSTHPRWFHIASRAVLVLDISSDGYDGPLSNWTTIRKVGK